MIYFTSDNHFYHKSVIGFCKRPYLDVKEMNEGLILKWNERVRPEDTVIVVGDFCFGNSSQREEILSRMNGTKLLIQGNHDKCKKTPKGFDLMVGKMSMEIAGHKVTISHYPLKWSPLKRFFEKIKRFPKKLYQPKYLNRMEVNQGQFHIHGHTHSPEKFKGNQIHVGVDAWDFYPVSIKQIEKFIHGQTSKNLHKP